MALKLSLKCLRMTHPLSQVVGEKQISGEVVGKRRVEFEDLLQSIAFDDVQVTVGQSSDVGAGLSESHLFPENITENISFTCRKEKNIPFKCWVTFVVYHHQAVQT